MRGDLWVYDSDDYFTYLSGFRNEDDFYYPDGLFAGAVFIILFHLYIFIILLTYFLSLHQCPLVRDMEQFHGLIHTMN